MPLSAFIPGILIYLFGIWNLFGIRPDLVTQSLIHGALGLSIFVFVRYFKINTHFIRSNALPFFIITFILLVGTHFFGQEIKGSKRWLDLGLFPLQTSELFKIFYIAFFATIFAKASHELHQSYLFIKTLSIALVSCVVIFLQPDLATSIITFGIYFMMLLHSPVSRKQITTFFIITVLCLPIFWFIMQDYQKARITSFLGTETDRAGSSYNMTQAMIAVGSGQFLGKGLGMGKQSQLSFLPEYHTDFAFSSLVEQFGFLGGAMLIGLYLWFFSLIFFYMLKHIDSKDFDRRYLFYYLVGFSLMMISQAVVNIGMNVGLLPIAGVTLPLVSYGGSSLITFILGMAFIPAPPSKGSGI